MLSIVVGTIAIVLTNGFISYSMWGLRESMIHNGIGHFQLYKKGYLEEQEKDPYEYTISDYKQVVKNLYRLQGVSYVAPRLMFQGILSNGENSAIVIGFGGWSEEEAKLNSFGTFEEGTFITDRDEYGVVIGSGLAKKLNAKVGNIFTLMATTRGGGFNAIDVEVKGIITLQVEEYNKTFMLAPLTLVQKLTDLNEGVDRLVVVLRNTDDTDRLKEDIKKICEKYDLEYKTWKDIATFYFQACSLYNAFFTTMMVIIVGVILFAIANTMSMSIYERFREIGTIRAIGAKRSKVVTQFLLEAVLLSVIGGVIGIIFGYIIAGAVNLSGGIYIPPPPGNARGYYAFIRPELIKIAQYWFVFILVSIIATLLPAYRAARMNIVDALRWI